jgi:Winged helix DNA-binding domain
MKREAILAWRMRRQYLTERAPAAAALDVISTICGLHAQVMSSAEAMLQARAEVPDDYVERALWEHGTLSKTWAMRGTLHLLVTAELPLYTGAQSALRPRTSQPTWLRHFKLTPGQAQAILDEVPRALADGPLTREQLAAQVAARSGHAELEERLSGGYGDLLKPVAFRGDLVFAPSDGQKVRFARPAPFAPLPTEEATEALARRFLSVYGPATREDLAKWFGMPSAPMAGRWIAQLEDAVEVEGGWMLAEHAAEAEREVPTGAVRLLPAFDQYVVAARRDQVGEDVRARVYRPGGWFSPVLLADGEILGVWRRDGDVVAIEPFADVGEHVRAGAEAEAARLHGSGVRWG